MATSLSLSPQHAPPPSSSPWPWPSSSSTSPSKAYNFTSDCSYGICYFNCPPGCILPPPPPLFLNSDGDDGSSSSSRISPLMAALIAVLAAAFLLLFYFTVISRFCRNRRNRNRNRNNNSASPFIDDWAGAGPLSSRVDSLVRDPARPDAGLDDAFIRQITVFKYRREDKLVEGTECAVCLNEFNEGENLRLMPNCEHAFHIPCIDTWLKTHSNCPLCRSTMNPVPPPPPPVHVTSSGSSLISSQNNTGSGLISSHNNRNNNNGNVNVNVGVAALRVERSNDVVLLIREVDNSVHVVDEVVIPNLDEVDTKLQLNNNNNNNNR